MASVRRRLVLYGLLAVLGLVAVTFVLIAANAGLSTLVGPVVAPLLIALAAAMIAIIAFLVMTAQEDAARRREAERRRAAETSALMSSAILGVLPTLLKSATLRQVGIPVALALASAFLLRKSEDDGPNREP